MPRNRAFFVSLLLAVLAVAGGCQQPRGDTLDCLLIGEVMMHAELSANLRTLAMPGGRLTGTPNAERAEAFVADKLREYGLQNVHFEPFDMHCWTVRETRVTVLAGRGKRGLAPSPASMPMSSLPAGEVPVPVCGGLPDEPARVLEGSVALARTLSTPPGGVTAEVVDLVEPNEAEFAARGEELRGKFVLARDGGMRRGAMLRLACEHGAAGLIVMAKPDQEPIIGNGHREPRPEPAVVIRHDQELIDQLARGEPVRVNIQLETANWECRPSNVVGEIPGLGPLASEVVLVGAHLDSWHLGEGAMDNGIGSAVILETARALTHVGWQPRRTVRFVWFMAEELGLVGSEAYVRDHKDELDHIVAVVNVDMPGSPRTFGQFGHPELEPFLQNVRRDLAGYELDEKIGEWNGDGSDHAPFAAQGIAALSLGGELGPGVKGYHTAGDTYESVDRRATIPSSAVLAVVVERLADAAERPGVRLTLSPAK